jgi:type VI protein secretion system component VasK
MNYSFKTLWNRMFVIVAPVWFLLVWMIWSSGQLKTEGDHRLFLGLVIPGFMLIYLSGFLIQKRHAKKLQGMQS